MFVGVAQGQPLFGLKERQIFAPALHGDGQVTEHLAMLRLIVEYARERGARGKHRHNLRRETEAMPAVGALYPVIAVGRNKGVRPVARFGVEHKGDTVVLKSFCEHGRAPRFLGDGQFGTVVVHHKRDAEFFDRRGVKKVVGSAFVTGVVDADKKAVSKLSIDSSVATIYAVRARNHYPPTRPVCQPKLGVRDIY
jgi:hypothetical protein